MLLYREGRSVTVNVRQLLYQLPAGEGLVLVAAGRHVDLLELPASGRLSLHAAHGGQQRFELGTRRVAVDDDVELLFDGGSSATASVRSITPVTTRSIFFPATVAAAEVAGPLAGHVFAARRSISALLCYLESIARSGHEDPRWLAEQLQFLQRRLAETVAEELAALHRVEGSRLGTRAKLFRCLRQAIDYIESRYESRLSLADIAREACMSQFHLLRQFKLAFGLTPFEYLRAKRQRVARRLLEGGRHSPTEIAAILGYASYSSFFRAFRSTYRCSPQSYARRAGLSGA